MKFGEKNSSFKNIIPKKKNKKYFVFQIIPKKQKYIFKFFFFFSRIKKFQFSIKPIHFKKIFKKIKKIKQNGYRKKINKIFF